MIYAVHLNSSSDDDDDVVEDQEEEDKPPTGVPEIDLEKSINYSSFLSTMNRIEMKQEIRRLRSIRLMNVCSL